MVERNGSFTLIGMKGDLGCGFDSLAFKQKWRDLVLGRVGKRDPQPQVLRKLNFPLPARVIASIFWASTAWQVTVYFTLHEFVNLIKFSRRILLSSLRTIEFETRRDSFFHVSLLANGITGF